MSIRSTLGLNETMVRDENMKCCLFLRERVLYINSEEILSYRKGFLIYRKIRKGQIRKCNIGNIINRLELLERMLRKAPRCAARIDKEHFIISFKGKILNYNCNRNEAIEEHSFKRGMNNPLQFLSVPDHLTNKNDILYGEYMQNEEKNPVAIYKRSNRGWNKVYEFPGGVIKHIHNIVYDIYRNGFIILTGDEDSESGIWFADYNFLHVRPILTGGQQYRACVAFPVEKGLYYATDTPLESNYIYFLELDQEGNIKNLRKEVEIPGSCIYGQEKNGILFFSTTVESDSSLPKYRHGFTYKLGKGIKDRYAHVIMRQADGVYRDIIQVKKDFLPMGLFQFGTFIFPQNESDDLLLVAQGLTEGNGVSFVIEQV